MSLPDGFNEFEHLQSVVMRVHNRLVREEFSDLGGDDWDSSITTPRGSLRVACTLKDNDTADMIQMRYNLFYLDLRKAKDLQAPIYGTPVSEAQAQRKHKPQIGFYFKEDLGDVDDDYAPVEGRISYRLMTETSTSITRQELITIGNKIKLEFGIGNGFVWKKGKDLASYVDKPNGFQFQLLVRSKVDAQEIIRKVLETNNKTPDWNKLSYKEAHSPTGAYPTLPSAVTILGKSRREPRVRPMAQVRFQYAWADIWALPTPLILYDKTGEHINALVS